jgi:hypothetical protein
VNPLPTFDLRSLDLAGFRRWLAMHFEHWASDPVFAQRLRIRDLRGAHPELRRLEAERARAVRAEAASEHGPRLREIDRRLYDVGRALDGLADALSRAEPNRQPALAAKRHAFAERRRILEEERDTLADASPLRQQLARATANLDRVRTAIGLDREEAALDQLLKSRGRGSGRAGIAFEEVALEVARTRILPIIGEGEPHILRTVRLAAAGVELDIVIVRRDRPDEPVEVLAVVEAKRNINDLGHGFRRRQIDLAWLTGDRSAYDPADHRTGFFDTGHFDRSAVHWQDGDGYLFGPKTFRRFIRDPGSGYFLDPLFLVTRAGPIWGLSSAALARVAAMISTDESWDPNDEGYLGRFFNWVRTLAGPIETPDVMRLYSGNAERARHLVIL